MNTNTVEVTFKKRTTQQVADKVALNDASVPTVKTTYDFSALTEEQILQWAVRGVTIHVQAQMKSGALKDDALDNKTFKVPEPGDRKRLTVEDKIRRLVADILKIKISEVTREQIALITRQALPEDEYEPTEEEIEREMDNEPAGINKG
jgi:hypothetical protein